MGAHIGMDIEYLSQWMKTTTNDFTIYDGKI